MLDVDFKMNMFFPLYSEFPAFEAYLTYYSEEKAFLPIVSL